MINWHLHFSTVSCRKHTSDKAPTCVLFALVEIPLSTGLATFLLISAKYPENINVREERLAGLMVSKESQSIKAGTPGREALCPQTPVKKLPLWTDQCQMLDRTRGPTSVAPMDLNWGLTAWMCCLPCSQPHSTARVKAQGREGEPRVGLGNRYDRGKRSKEKDTLRGVTPKPDVGLTTVREGLLASCEHSIKEFSPVLGIWKFMLIPLRPWFLNSNQPKNYLGTIQSTSI